MTRALDKKSGAHTTSPWEATALQVRCVEPEGDPTEVIPVALLHRLLEETAQDGGVQGGSPRFEIVELDPEDVILDEGAFEVAFEEMVCAPAGG